MTSRSESAPELSSITTQQIITTDDNNNNNNNNNSNMLLVRHESEVSQASSSSSTSVEATTLVGMVSVSFLNKNIYTLYIYIRLSFDQTMVMVVCFSNANRSFFSSLW
jgi:hypothetical protein